MPARPNPEIQLPLGTVDFKTLILSIKSNTRPPMDVPGKLEGKGAGQLVEQQTKKAIHCHGRDGKRRTKVRKYTRAFIAGTW